MKTKHTVFTHNGGYDSILLLDDDLVVSAWDVTPENLDSYLTDTDAENWESQFLEDRIEDYGHEVGRDGTLSAERRSFYKIQDYATNE